MCLFKPLWLFSFVKIYIWRVILQKQISQFFTILKIMFFHWAFQSEVGLFWLGWKKVYSVNLVCLFVCLFVCIYSITGYRRGSSLKWISLTCQSMIFCWPLATWPWPCHRYLNTHTLLKTPQLMGPHRSSRGRKWKCWWRSYRSLKLIRPRWPNSHGVGV